MGLPYAETCPYFQTGKSQSDTWIAKAKEEIRRAKGVVQQHAFGSDEVSGRAAWLLSFRVGAEEFRITWPVLQSKNGNDGAAKTQAATMLFHDVKAKCVKARVFGMRTAFFEHLVLPDGREAHQVATPELLDVLPELLQPPQPPRLTSNT